MTTLWQQIICKCCSFCGENDLTVIVVWKKGIAVTVRNRLVWGFYSLYLMSKLDYDAVEDILACFDTSNMSKRFQLEQWI